MKGFEMKLVAYMQGSDKRFIIPVYQRNYEWKIENCKQLYNDLIKVIRNERSSHFFGSVVSVNNDGGFNEYLVIDGQQRVTTISLLFLAMYHLLQKGVASSEKKYLAGKIYKDYLVDEYAEGDARIKLKPVKNDREAFNRLFDEDAELVANSNLTINYQYFYERIQKEELSVDELFDAITRLEIINISLNQEDNPQLIFESLNSTGLALNEGDKIRNFILMGLPSKQQNEFYEKYWSKIEACTDHDVSSFVRDYLSVKQLAISSINKVYFTFKAYVEESKLDTESLLREMYSYAKWYEILLKGKTKNESLNACIYRINRLETTVTRPFFLEVLRLESENTLTIVQVREIFQYTENYLFRRVICDLPTNTLSKIFLMLHREIIRFDGTANDYVEKFKYAISSKNERVRFPDDVEFEEAFSKRQVYQMNSKNKIYLLERLENSNTIEDKSIYIHCDRGDYSIEHIMPQHLTPAWIRELGENYDEIHTDWLHRIANLTLTGYNSNYSNNTFVEKRDMEHGFKQSGLRLNGWIGQQEHWSLKELQARDQQLRKLALKIWPMPISNFKPTERQMDLYTLEDDVDLTGRQIIRFAYKNAEQPISSWVDMMGQILKILHTDDKSVLTQMASVTDDDNEISSYVSTDPKALRNALKIDEDIYMERNTNTNMKLSMLRKFFKAFGANPEDLVFYLKEQNDSSEQENSASNELRYRYWNYALPIIQQANGENGKEWKVMSGGNANLAARTFGMSGFSILCTANYDKVRVHLALSNGDQTRNKTTYDYLFSNKEQIERKVGAELNWDRYDQGKSSYVSIKLEGVSIQREVDWGQMTRFLAEWSKKFYDTFVPMLREYMQAEIEV